MSPDTFRRRFLVVAGTGASLALAGCFARVRVDDLRVVNPRDERVTVTVTVTRQSDDAVVLDETTTVEADGERVYADPITGESAHEVELSTADGLRGTYTWEYSEDEGVTVRATLSEYEIRFDELAA